MDTTNAASHRTRKGHRLPLFGNARRLTPTHRSHCKALGLLCCGVAAWMHGKHFGCALDVVKVEDVDANGPHFADVVRVQDVPAPAPVEPTPAPVEPTPAPVDPHLADCREIEKNDPEEGIFVTTTTEPKFEMSIYDPIHDMHVSKQIKELGCWECGSVNSMISALKSHENSFFLDIGGNIGMWSLAAAAVGKDTYTIEPNPTSFNRICKSVNRNSFHDRVNLFTIAATTTPAVFDLKVPQHNRGAASVIEVAADEESSSHIKGFPIDSLNIPTNRPVVVKIDVEGHELDALLGAKKFLQESKVVYFAVEFRSENLRENREDWSEIFGIFKSKGLSPFRKNGREDADIAFRPVDPDDLLRLTDNKVFDVVFK